jgi:hypothetical protein
VKPFGFGNMTFNGYVIDLSVIVSPLPFIVEVGIGTSGNGKNCTVGGEIIGLLWRLTDL